MYIWFQKGQQKNLAGPENLHKIFSSFVSVRAFIKHTNTCVLYISYPVEDFGRTNGRRWSPTLGKTTFAKHFYNNFKIPMTNT